MTRSEQSNSPDEGERGSTFDVAVIGGGLAGSEAALQLSARGLSVRLFERRPRPDEPVHKTGYLAELVCSNSLKSTKRASAAGMLKQELSELDSFLLDAALKHRVDAGGALAVDRTAFAQEITSLVAAAEGITLVHGNVVDVSPDGSVEFENEQGAKQQSGAHRAIVVASGPLTEPPFASWLEQAAGSQGLAFYDAAAPIVLADSLDSSIVFRQSRYEEDAPGDYLNAPFDKLEYESFIDALLEAERVVARDFETAELFQACQPVEEIARKGRDALRFGAMKPVGLVDPRSGKRPWAVVQLRAEDRYNNSYNLVGFQTNLTFPEQQHVFRMIPGLQHAEFVRFGVMHRNTFLDAPRCMNATQRLSLDSNHVPVFLAGQIAGTEGYCEAIRSGIHAAISCCALLAGKTAPVLPDETAYGALLAYACNPETVDYQPKHVNFGDMPPLAKRIKNKGERYSAFAERGEHALRAYRNQLDSLGLSLAGKEAGS